MSGSVRSSEVIVVTNQASKSKPKIIVGANCVKLCAYLSEMPS